MRILRKTNFDFMAQRKRMYMLSAVIILAGLISLFTKGLDFGIDFLGGTELIVGFSSAPEIGKVRDMMNGGGYEGAEIKTFGRPDRILIRTEKQGEGSVIADDIKAALDREFAGLSPRILEEEKIGPKIGAELRRDAIYAVLLSLVAIGAYIGFRFKFIYGLGAIVSLFHDVLVTLGLMSILDGLTPFTNFEVDQNLIAALLTLTGLSVNDTVVIFDRVRENQTRYKTLSLKDNLNRSLNETLSRTFITAGTILTATAILFLFGGEVNRGFGFALTVGILTGTYSTIYVASAIVLDSSREKKTGQTEPAAAPKKASYETVQ